MFDGLYGILIDVYQAAKLIGCIYYMVEGTLFEGASDDKCVWS